MRQFLDMGVSRSQYPKSAHVPKCIHKWCTEKAAPVFLLVRMAPNLTSLCIEVPCTWKMNGLGQGSPDGTFLPKFTFPNLKRPRLMSVTTGWWTTDSCQTIIGCLLVATPNLEALELSRCAELDRELILPPHLASLVLVDSSYQQ
jgi:hypothetical protein